MAYKRKSWIEKRDLANDAHIEVTNKDFADIPAGSTMFIATPKMVEDYLRHIPKGKTGDLKQMRKDLAAEHGAQYTCPVTAGIFLRIVAEAAWEEMQEGKKPAQVAPFWRMVAPKSTTAAKLSFGTEFLLEQHRKEHIFQPSLKVV